MNRHTNAVRRLTLLCLGLALTIAAARLVARDEKPKVSADEALKLLQAGNARFVADKPEHPNSDLNRVQETGKNGQFPIAAVLGCADSRVPVETVFDRGVGDLFVVRVAGNVAGTTELASLEYAVDHLGVSLIVVLGHTKCGAVQAAVAGGELPGNLPALIDDITPAVRTAEAENPNAPADKLLAKAISENVRQQIAAAQRKSAPLRKAVAAGSVKFVGAVYDIDTGVVHWLDDASAAK
jgi:carbonic anhydrase